MFELLDLTVQLRNECLLMRFIKNRTVLKGDLMVGSNDLFVNLRLTIYKKMLPYCFVKKDHLAD